MERLPKRRVQKRYKWKKETSQHATIQQQSYPCLRLKANGISRCLGMEYRASGTELNSQGIRLNKTKQGT